MNIQKIRGILNQYKQHFGAIHKEEIYKWRAVKGFQDNWDITDSNFYEMLQRSLKGAKNLLDSVSYPKKMILQNAERNPDFVRELFIDLYDEERSLTERIASFRQRIKIHNRKLFPKLQDYQDPRAVLVYLCLRYPDRYYLYKYEMFKEFCELIEYPYKPKKGDLKNIVQYMTVCNLLKEEIIRDRDLLALHETRITSREYFDNTYNILTQDVIYAAVHHIAKFEQQQMQQAPPSSRLTKVDRAVSAKTTEVSLRGSFTNYIENEKENKRIGHLGELLVLQYEKEKLLSLRSKKIPEHKSATEGDGLGYDILSFDEKGNEIFIEVKTTIYGDNTSFFITRNELQCSILKGEAFYLYRLYGFNDINQTAKFFSRAGNLTELCVDPILYKVSLNANS